MGSNGLRVIRLKVARRFWRTPGSAVISMPRRSSARVTGDK
jgi:hypothetical protein